MRELNSDEIEAVGGGGSAWDDFWYNVGYAVTDFMIEAGKADDAAFEEPISGTTGLIPFTA